MPTLGDMVKVRFTIQGETVIWEASGSISAVNGQAVDITISNHAPWKDVPFSALASVGQLNTWSLIAQVKLETV